jgi:hypothetical protein
MENAADLVEILAIDIHPSDAPCDRAVDVLQAVPSRNTQDSNTLRPAVIESILEQFCQHS